MLISNTNTNLQRLYSKQQDPYKTTNMMIGENMQRKGYKPDNPIGIQG